MAGSQTNMQAEATRRNAMAASERRAATAAQQNEVSEWNKANIIANRAKKADEASQRAMAAIKAAYGQASTASTASTASPASPASPASQKLEANQLRGVYKDLLDRQQRQVSAMNVFNQAQAARQAQSQAAIGGYTPEMAARLLQQFQAQTNSDVQTANADIRDYETGLIQQQEQNTQNAVQALAESNPEFYQKVLAGLASTGSWDGAYTQAVNESGGEIPTALTDYERAAKADEQTLKRIQELRLAGNNALADDMEKRFNEDKAIETSERNSANAEAQQESILNRLMAFDGTSGNAPTIDVATPEGRAAVNTLNQNAAVTVDDMSDVGYSTMATLFNPAMKNQWVSIGGQPYYIQSQGKTQDSGVNLWADDWRKGNLTVYNPRTGKNEVLTVRDVDDRY
jgi:hypothetical protein